MKGYFEGYNDGIDDTKRNIVEIIEKYKNDEPNATLSAIKRFCRNTRMREIKFRGRRLDNNEWVCGYLYRLPLPSGVATMILTTDNNHMDDSIEPKYHLAFTLWTDLFLVAPATVGQFTGLYDKDGNEIYNGDILAANGKQIGYVVDGVRGYCYDVVYTPPLSNGERDWSLFGVLTRDYPNKCYVIGNVHDNPELIK